MRQLERAFGETSQARLCPQRARAVAATFTATAGEGAEFSTLSDKLKAQLDLFSIPSAASEVIHNMLIGTMFETTYRSASLP